MAEKRQYDSMEAALVAQAASDALDAINAGQCEDRQAEVADGLTRRARYAAKRFTSGMAVIEVEVSVYETVVASGVMEGAK